MAPITTRRVAILGTRGIPAAHGGFETFAQRLSLWLIDRGWDVEVYCQNEGGDAPDNWRGVDLRHIRTKARGPLGTMEFDLRSVLKASARDQLILTLGYNTAIFSLLHRVKGAVNVVNMDGLEWKRSKWSWGVRQWFKVNERCATILSDHLIADHPRIADRLRNLTSKKPVTMIPYGSDPIVTADASHLGQFGIAPQEYALAIARIEPENQTLDMVRAFSAKPRGKKLMVLGALVPERYSYHAAVQAAAGPEVIFPGSIYEPPVVEALRRHALFYIHGHQVGGTNPTLVETLGAGCPVLAHGNEFNTWVAGPAQAYFSSYTELEEQITRLVQTPADCMRAMSDACRQRHAEDFRWDPILQKYEDVLLRLIEEKTNVRHA